MKQTVFALFAFFTLSISGVAAQDLASAAEEFNKAIGLSKDSKYAEAAAAYEKTISICKQLGDEGMDLQLKAEQQLPITYFNLGKALFEEKKYNEAITNFEKSVQWADQMGETKTGDASRAYLAGIYYALGNSDLKKEDADNALAKYTKALSFNPDYYKAYYGLGLVYKIKENLPLMKENLDKAIAMAGDDEKTIGNAKDAATSAFQKEGALALQASKFNDAVSNLLASQEYDNSEPRTYFYLSIAYNALARYDDAVNAATKALELQAEDKSDIYFELAKAYEKKGENSLACENYKNVTSGNNVAAAKYQIEQVLKCQ